MLDARRVEHDRIRVPLQASINQSHPRLAENVAMNRSAQAGEALAGDGRLPDDGALVRYAGLRWSWVRSSGEVDQVILVRVASSYLLEEDQIDVVGFAEERMGEGRAFIIQVPRQLEDADESYNLSTETGASYYGGIDALQIDRHSSKVTVTLSQDAARVLGTGQALELKLDVPTDLRLPVFNALGRFAAREGISISESR